MTVRRLVLALCVVGILATAGAARPRAEDPDWGGCCFAGDQCPGSQFCCPVQSCIILITPFLDSQATCRASCRDLED